MKRNRSTGAGGIPLPDDPLPAKRRETRQRAPDAPRARPAGALTPPAGPPADDDAGARDGALQGREPCSYLLDPKVNYVPELPVGGEDPLGRHGLCFTGRHPDSGRRFELVTLPDGCAFDLLGMGGRSPDRPTARRGFISTLMWDEASGPFRSLPRRRGRGRPAAGARHPADRSTTN